MSNASSVYAVALSPAITDGINQELHCDSCKTIPDFSPKTDLFDDHVDGTHCVLGLVVFLFSMLIIGYCVTVLGIGEFPVLM